MKIYYEDLGAGLFIIPKDYTWHLQAELNDRDEAVIFLKLGELDFQLCNGREYIRDQVHLGSLDVLEFYTTVIENVYNMLSEGPVDFIDLEEIKDAVMPTFWEAWKNRGIVDGECRKCEEA